MQKNFTYRKHFHHYNRNHTLLTADEIELVRSGNDYFTRALDMINRSKQKIHLQVYIFIDDSTGKSMIEALKNAAKRKVKVSVLADAFGSHSLSREAISSMKNSGIKFRTFSPLFVNYRLRFGRRLHHKILGVDENEALIGGINVEDKYHIKKEDNTPWLDYAAYIKGPVCKYVDYLCENTWEGKFYAARMNRHQIHYNSEHKKGIEIRVRQNDWVKKKEGISRSLRNELRNAHESITIIGAYFLPGRRIRRLLKAAAARQVAIKLILQGVSDVLMVRKATMWWYAWMLRNNIEIYEWKQTMLHGKITMVDDGWVSIGSCNINHLSDYDSIETNIDVRDPVFCHTVKQEMERVIKSAEQVTYSEYHHTMNPFQQFTCWLSFHIIRMLFGLETLLISKE